LGAGSDVEQSESENEKMLQAVSMVALGGGEQGLYYTCTYSPIVGGSWFGLQAVADMRDYVSCIFLWH
jgi:hypothetical protein